MNSKPLALVLACLMISSAAIVMTTAISIPLATASTDVITNGSFVSDTSSWSFVAVAGSPTGSWDSAGYANGGAAKISTEVGKRIDGEGYWEQTISTTIDAGLAVTLSYAWKKGYVVKAPQQQDIYITIVKPDATTVDIDSQLGAPGAYDTWYTVSDKDVSASFDQTGTYKIRLRYDYRTGPNDSAQAFAWFDEVKLIVATPLPPTIGLSPTSLTFNAVEGGLNPPSQTVTVTNTGPAGSTLNWSATDNATWLSESPTSGSLASGASEPMTVSVDITGLVAGTYNATITVSDPNATNSPQTVSVELVVAPSSGQNVITNGGFVSSTDNWSFLVVAGAPTGSWDPNGYANGGCAKISSEVGKLNDGEGYWKQTISTTIEAGLAVKLSYAWKKGYVAKAPTQKDIYITIVKPDATTVDIDSQLGAPAAYDTWYTVSEKDVSAYFNQTGTYEIRLRYDYKTGANASAQAFAWFDEVKLIIATAPPPTIGLSPTSLTFNAVEGGANPPSQTVTVTNTGPAGSTLNWGATDDATWLSESPTSGSLASGASEPMTVSVDITGLAAGTYNATITVSDPNATNSPQTVSVELVVATPPPPPTIGLSPTSLTFNAVEGGANPPSQTVTVTNTGPAGSTLNWSATDDATWLSESPTSGSLASGASEPMTVSVNITGLAAGTYNATITVSDPNATNSPQTVSVTLVVEPAAGNNWVEKADTPDVGGYGESVSGDGSYVYVAQGLYATSTPQFWRYTPGTNTWGNLSITGLPTGAFRNGTALAWDNGDYIYALGGARYSDSDRRLFFRYSISGDSWTQMADTTGPQGAGDAITWSGYDGYIYSIIGSNTHGTVFARYNPSSGLWETRASPPGGTDDGCSLVWTGGTYLYALRGEYLETTPLRDFWRYDIVNNSWSSMADIPEPEGVGDGGSLLWPGNWLSAQSDYIYALSGGDPYPEQPGYHFYRYSISNNSWQQMADILYGITDYNGGRLGFAAGHIYYWQGMSASYPGGGKKFCMYEFPA